MDRTINRWLPISREWRFHRARPLPRGRRFPCFELDRTYMVQMAVVAWSDVLRTLCQEGHRSLSVHLAHLSSVYLICGDSLLGRYLIEFSSRVPVSVLLSQYLSVLLRKRLL